MKINHNIPAIRTLNELNKVNNKAADSMLRLSSGLRINSAADDAAGMAIANKMDAQVRGLRQANRNTMDGVSMVQTAEGALNEVHAILHRMRELSVQASNGTYSKEDTEKIQQEINELTEEINRIGETTEFNQKPLLKGSDDKTGLFIGDIKFEQGQEEIEGTKSQATISLDNIKSYDDFMLAVSAPFKIEGPNGSIIEIPFYDSRTTPNPPANGIDIFLIGPDGNYAEGLTEAVASKMNELLGGAEYEISVEGKEITIKNNEIGIIGNDLKVSFMRNEIQFAGGVDTVEEVKATGELKLQDKISLEQLKNLDGKVFTILPDEIEIAFYDSSNPKSKVKEGAIDINTLMGDDEENYKDALGMAITTALVDKGLESQYDITKGAVQIQGNTPGVSEEIKIIDGKVDGELNVTLQVGANKGQVMDVQIGDMRADALGLTAMPGEEGYSTTADVSDGKSTTPTRAAVDVTTQANANNAITKFDNAISMVSNQRSKLGAVQNRLEHTTKNLGVSEENLTASMSRIQDADMAYEMAQYTQQNVISQAATAMLAQANQRPQQVLQLLQR
ncbi:MAG: flagellin [Cellulosilyticaceae bacterium]